MNNPARLLVPTWSHTIDRPSCLIATSQTWPSTAVLPSLLAEAGIRTIGFSPGQLAHNGHVSEHIRCSREPSEAAAELAALRVRRRFDWTIVGDEFLLRELARRPDRDAFTDWFPIHPSDGTALDLLVSKFAFALAGPRLGLAIPESFVAATLDEALAHAALLGYPVVLKGDRGFAGIEVRIAGDEQAARATAASVLRRYGRVLVQRHIDGLRVGVSVLYAGGEPLVYSSYRTVCCFPTPTSPSTVHEFFAHPDIESVVRSIGSATGFHGMLGIDFMVDSANGLHPIEINPRPTLSFCGTAANRRFFAPFVKRFVRGEHGAPLAFDGRETTQTYFPGHLFYFVTANGERDWRALGRLTACLREARLAHWRVSAWEIARFGYDALGERLPRLRAFLDAKRGAVPQRELFSA